MRASSLGRLGVVLLAAAAGLNLGACADSAGSRSDEPGESNGLYCGLFREGQTCDRDSACAPHLHCVQADPREPKFTCQRVSGRCTPGADPRASCFAGARCEAVREGGLCTFAPASPVFFATDRELSVLGPDDRASTRLQPGQTEAGGFSFRWEQPRLRADAITVVAVLRKPPRRSSTGNRIANVDDIVWLWTSDSAGQADAQTADISAGRAGLRPDGLVSTVVRRGLGAGEYFWLVYTIEQGRVTASSRVRRYAVLPVSGSLGDAGSCDGTEADCVARRGGVSEDWACVQRRCVPRCSSDLDCTTRGMRCNLTEPYCGLVGRNSGYCGDMSALPDAGLSGLPNVLTVFNAL